VAWPAPKRIAIFTCVLSWLGIQILFFIPHGWPEKEFVFTLKSKQGDFYLFQKGRGATLVGAYSDRYERFPRLELVPFLKKRGITHLTQLILTGHQSSETGALSELNKNFHIKLIMYPLGLAEQMRKTFNQIQRNTQMRRLSSDVSGEW
jgi:beta-lactamase superfamily II metal-dependent hydrolase